MGTVSSSNRVTGQDRAVLQMKVQRDNLKRYQKSIQVVLDREREIAKECLARGDKSKALLALRKRKYQEQMLKKTDGHLETLEQLVSTVEFALIQKDVAYGLEQGNSVLKAVNKEMSIERVELILGESADAIAYQKEVSDMLANQMTNEDEDAVEDELAELQRQAIAEHLGIQATPELPNVPNTDIETQYETPEQSQKARTAERRRLERQPMHA